MKNIKIAVFMHDELDLDWDFRPEDLSDREFYMIAMEYGKIYSVKDFQYLWNNVELKYNPDNSYFRVVDENNMSSMRRSMHENKIYESMDYDYDENLFNPKDCLTWLIKTGLLDRFNSSYDIDEWAEMAQSAAEEAGVPLDDAERVYDVAYMKYAR